RVLDRLQLKSDRLSRQQFSAYAGRYLREDDSPPWNEPKAWDLDAEATRMFRRFDQDGDGKLRGEEIPVALHSRLGRWDRNGDGAIEADEYRAYFPGRLETVRRELEREAGTRGLDAYGRRKVMRAGKLPVEVPTWFRALDTDEDAQIS